MSHPLSIIVVWSNNYRMICIDVTNLHSLIACYIQAILVLTLKTNTAHTHQIFCVSQTTHAACFVRKHLFSNQK